MVVIPELAAVAGAFFALLGVVTAISLLFIWTNTFGKMLQWLAGQLRFTIKAPFFRKTFDFGGPFKAVDRIVIDSLQTWLTGAEIELGYFLHGNAKLLEWTAKEIAATADAAAGFGEWLVHVRLPRWAKVLGTVAFPWPAIYRAIRAEVAKELPHVSRLVRVVTHTITHETVRVVKYAGAATIPGALTIPHVWPAIRGLTRRNVRIHARLHRLEALFGVAAMAAVMANVLGLPNWRCLTRGNIGRGARAFCGLDRWLVDLLLLGSIEAFIVADLCEFSDLLISEAESVRPVLLSLVDVEDALIDCHGTSAPIELTLPPLSLSPMPDVSALAA